VEKSLQEIFIGNLTSLTRGQLVSDICHCSEQSKRKCQLSNPESLSNSCLLTAQSVR